MQKFREYLDEVVRQGFLGRKKIDAHTAIETLMFIATYENIREEARKLKDKEFWDKVTADVEDNGTENKKNEAVWHDQLELHAQILSLKIHIKDLKKFIAYLQMHKIFSEGQNEYHKIPINVFKDFYTLITDSETTNFDIKNERI